MNSQTGGDGADAGCDPSALPFSPAGDQNQQWPRAKAEMGRVNVASALSAYERCPPSTTPQQIRRTRRLLAHAASLYKLAMCCALSLVYNLQSFSLGPSHCAGNSIHNIQDNLLTKYPEAQVPGWALG